MFVDQFPVDLPSSSDPSAFDPRADAYYGHLPTFVAQLNALANLLATAAAPPMSIPYQFSSSTTIADPGPGKVRLDNAVQTSSTAFLADLVSGIGQTVTGLLDQMGTSTSVVKGYLTMRAVGDPTRWITWPVTALASPTGYKNFTLQSGQGVGSSASPFADTDLVTVSFVPKGDKGDTGNSIAWNQIGATTTISGSPSSVTITGIPASYADLKLEVAISLSTGADLTLLVSLDGASFTSVGAVTSAGNTTYNGSVLIFDYLSTQAAMLAAVDTPKAARATGPIVALRLTTSTGTFSSGTLKLKGR